MQPDVEAMRTIIRRAAPRPGRRMPPTTGHDPMKPSLGASEHLKTKAGLVLIV